MIILDNKKAQDFGEQGLIDVNNIGKSTMTSLALSFNDVNFTPVQHEQQIWLTASELAKALGYAKSDAVTQVYERNKDEFNPSMTLTLKLRVKGFGSGNSEKDTRIFSLRGCHLIAMFAKTSVAKLFRKWVLDVLDREVLTRNINGRESISPEQQALLHEIVARRSSGERKVYAEMWARHNRHFKIPRYAELLSIHFPDSIHYLETMEIKGKPETKKAEPVALPYPQQVVQIAQQINQEFAGGRYTSWLVSARDGDLSATPLPHGYYPAMDLGEFTKHFDGILNMLYASGALNLGRQMLKDRDSK